MRVADGVEMLEISANVMGHASLICPTLIWDENETILVDAGYPGQLPLFRQEAERAGASFNSLSKVILTHQDIDHIGGLPAMLSAATRKIEVLASDEDRPYIQGEKRTLRFTPEAITQAMAALPPGIPEERRSAFRSALENPPSAPVDRTLADGEELPYCGGIVVIKTPGHTPGHICLYHEPSKTLIAGDALNIVDGELMGPVPQLALDLEGATASLRKFTSYDVEAVICYHGGLFRGDVNRRLAELAG